MNHTPEALLAAWEKRRRATWPATFERTMKSALLGRLVRLQADKDARAKLRQPELQSLPVTKREVPTPHTTPSLDGKSLASGEKPNED